jgi:hypothetical protein
MPNNIDQKAAMPDAESVDHAWLEGMKRIRLFPFPEEGPFVSPDQIEIDGMVAVGWDQNQELPAYRVSRPNGSSELVPFTPLAQIPPAGAGSEWYVDNFTDTVIKSRWRAARDSPELLAQIHAQRDNIAVPHQFRATGSIDPRGRIDANTRIDLRDIRRPGFFGSSPWREPIVEAEGATTIVEVAVPREPYERLHMGLSDAIAIRGWHLAGRGIPDGRGGRRRALVVLTAGRSIETTAIQHPDDEPAWWDDTLKCWIQREYPGAGTECWGARSWRNNYIRRFWSEGFDVLTLDKRGHGISGGDNDSNTNEQAHDVFRALEALETGIGLRLLTPEGELLEGGAAAGRLLAGYRRSKDIPVFLSGASQGCMVTQWAMHKNFVGSCDFDRSPAPEDGRLGYDIRGALLLAPFSAGLGYRAAMESLAEASRRAELNVQMFPTSEVLAHIHTWPALFIGRGLWDFAESLEGSFEAYRRASQPKDFVAVRGPHGENEWGQGNIEHLAARMVAFARRVLIDPQAGRPEFSTIRALVQAAPDHWPTEAWPRA